MTSNTTNINTATTANASSSSISNSNNNNDIKVATSIFLTIHPNQLSDIALILKTPIQKSGTSSTGDANINGNGDANGNANGDVEHDHYLYHEAVITNNDLLQARNKGKVQINNSPLLRVYPSYRNESIVEHYKNCNSNGSSGSGSKLSYPSLVGLVVPAVLLMSSVLSFFIVVDTTVPYHEYANINSDDSTFNSTCSGSDSGSDIVTDKTISGWDAIFPSYYTTPIVMKLTVWGTLIAIVAYEQSHFWYGSGGKNDYYFYGNKAKPIGVEVILDCSSSSIASINGYGNGIGMDIDGRKTRARASVTAGDGTNATMSKSRGLTINATADPLSPSSTSSSTLISGTPKRSNAKLQAVAAAASAAPVPSTPPLSGANSAPPPSLSTPPTNNSASPKKQTIPPIPKTKSEDPPESPPVSNIKSSASSNNISSKSIISSPNNSTTTPASSSTSTSISISTTPPNAKAKAATTPSPQTIPFRFIRATKGDMKAARSRWNDTLAWRKDLGMDTILSCPHPKIHIIKQNYPHYFHLRGKKNECCYYEKPPKMNLTELKKDKVNLDELLRHYALCCEFMWTEIEPTEEGKSIYVIDLDGIGIRDFAGEVVDFVKRASSFTGAHYPERSGSIYIINVPSWFSVIWNVVKPMVDDVTKKKITIMRYGKEAITKALMEKIDIENIPPEYGGKSMPLGESPEELKFMEHFAKLNNGN